MRALTSPPAHRFPTGGQPVSPPRNGQELSAAGGATSSPRRSTPVNAIRQNPAFVALAVAIREDGGRHRQGEAFLTRRAICRGAPAGSKIKVGGQAS